MLREQEILELVAFDKWFTATRAGIAHELYRAFADCHTRLGVLESRYAVTARALDAQAANASDAVSSHLKRMGF